MNFRKCAYCNADIDFGNKNTKYCRIHTGYWVYAQRAYAAKRRAVALGLTEHYTGWDLLELAHKYGEKCMCCETARHGYMGWVADHVVPLSLGGTNTIDNIQILCFSCNVQKRNQAIDYRPRIAELPPSRPD